MPPSPDGPFCRCAPGQCRVRPTEGRTRPPPEKRRDELNATDPGQCPAWDTGWQRCYRLVHNHLQAGPNLPKAAGDVVVQGEDLGRWVTAQG